MISSCPAFSVLGIGSVPYDCLFYMDTDGDPQETLEIPGGSVGNVLCALSWLGARAAVASVIGADVEGERTAAHLERFGVRTEWLQRKAGRRTRRLRIEVRRRGDAGANVDAEEGKDAGERGREGPESGTAGIPDHRFVHHPPYRGGEPADERLETGDWSLEGKTEKTKNPKASSLKSQVSSLQPDVSMRDLNPEPGWRKRAVEDFDWLHFDAPTRITLQMAREAAQRGKPVSYDFGRPPLWGVRPAIEMAESCTLLKTNRPLVPALGGSEDPESLFRRFERLRFLLVTDGEKEAQLFWRSARRNGHGIVEGGGTIGSAARAIVPARRVVDTVGAGDSCTAVLIHETAAALGLGGAEGAQGIPLTPGWAEGVLDKVTALAALVCQFPGATGYLYWLLKQEFSLDSLLESIIRRGGVPESCHLSPAQWKRLFFAEMP
jgi:sugar/nucleoside kinase (ribokinase family)